MLRRLLRILSEAGTADREKDSKYNGPFSYAGEWHSATIGFVAGVLTSYTGSMVPATFIIAAIFAEKVAERGSGGAYYEVRNEPWYAGGAMMIGLPIGLTLSYII